MRRNGQAGVGWAEEEGQVKQEGGEEQEEKGAPAVPAVAGE